MGRDKPKRRSATVSSTSESSSVTLRKRKSETRRRPQSATTLPSEALKKIRNKSVSSTKSSYETDTTQYSVIQIKLDRDRPITSQQKRRFEEFTRATLSKGVYAIVDEFIQHLKSYTPPGLTTDAFDAHMKKNRYKDVVCIDRTRVVLRNHTTDYIHANYVRGEPLINSFICTQGPVPSSVKDFWKMIAQERVGNIIMLCDTIEKGKEKCQQYWPKEEGRTLELSGIQIRNVKIDTTSDPTTVITTLEVICEKKERVTLKHFHWKTWPDKSVPPSVVTPFRILRNVRHSPRPTVVHCSAGIGRTGSIVALELCYQQMLCEQRLSVPDIVKLLRHMRMHAVQTELQYLYLFKCLLTVSQKYQTLPSDCTSMFDVFDREYQAVIDSEVSEDAPLI